MSNRLSRWGDFLLRRILQNLMLRTRIAPSLLAEGQETRRRIEGGRKPVRYLLILMAISSVAVAQELPNLDEPEKNKTEKEIVTIPTEDGLVYLSTIKPDVVKRFGPGWPLVGKLSFQGAGGDHSFSVHPTTHNGFSALTFTLDKEYDGIVGSYGCVDPSQRDSSTLTFIVSANKKVVWKSEPVTPSNKGGRFAVRLNGEKKLELWVKLKGYFEMTHSGWIEPVLVPPDFDLKERVNDLKKEAKMVDEKQFPAFYQRGLLLLGVAEVRNDKRSANTIRQAGLIAKHRLKM